MHITKPSDFARALRAGKYTSLGRYPLYFVCEDGEALSFEAAQENARQICQAIRDGLRDGWRVIGVDVNYEDGALFCAHTGKRIESAYAEDAS